jgi:hypothetical protein
MNLKKNIKKVLREYLNEQENILNNTFLKWFGDSKIIDKNGKPKIVYSGTDFNDNVIGFIRGTKRDKLISFNLVFLMPEERGRGIAYDIYRYFLNNGYTIKSDDEITDGTYSLYLKLLGDGFKPVVFDDDRVGLKK